MADAGDTRHQSATKPGSPPARHGRRDLLHALARTLTRADAVRVVAYVLLSLGGALAGSVAAIVLAALVQPGHVLAFGRGLPVPHGSAEMLALDFVAAMAAFAVLRWFAARLGASLASRYAARLRREVHARLIDAPLASLADSSSAEIANVLTYNVEIVTQGFNALLQLLAVGVTTAVSLGFALWVSPVLTLSLPVLAGFALIASHFGNDEHARISRRHIEDMTRLFWLSEDFPRRLRHVRSFEREDAERAGYATLAARIGESSRRHVELVATGRLILELLAAAGVAAIFVIGERWHGLDRSSLIAVGLLLGRLVPYLTSTRQNLQQLRLAVPAIELWQRYANLDSVRHEAAPPDPAVAVRELRIERVELRLPSVRLDIDDLILAPGELTLISGDSGIGKSSLVDVLAGMATPHAFTARIDGRRIAFDAYRRLVRKGAYVSQSVRPWQRTVRECLLWAEPGASDEALRRALADVGLGQRLFAARDGLDSALQGSSSRLSGGELQRLLLAQVLLRQPSLALLDEATSALDAASELRVLATLRRRLPHTILIVVSHRASVAAIADRYLNIGNDGVVTIAVKRTPPESKASPPAM